VAERIWPGSSVFRTKGYADVDFVVIQNNTLVGFIEVKARRFPHNRHPTTAVHTNKHKAGRNLRAALKVPSICAVLWTDTLGYFDLSTAPATTGSSG
jgi:hypothetical protein